jgi:hypothetical protein
MSARLIWPRWEKFFPLPNMDSRLYLYFVIAAITALIPELERLQAMVIITNMAWTIALLKSCLSGFIAAKAFQSSPTPP